MLLNRIWIALILAGFLTALAKLLFFHDVDVFPFMLKSIIELMETGIKFLLSIAGVMILWMGLMSVGERGGVIAGLTKATQPFLRRLFPGVPEGHPALGHIMMNFSANMLGLDNAATPLGLKAMSSLQELNPDKERASNAQIMFLVLNASSLTLLPVSVLAARLSAGAANPADVFVPILIATYCSTLTGLLLCIIRQRIRLDWVLIGGIGVMTGLMGLLIWHFAGLSKDKLDVESNNISGIFFLSIILIFILAAARKRVNVYDAFIDGAKQGWDTVIKIAPYLIGMFLAVGFIRYSGALDVLLKGFAWLYAHIASLFTPHADLRFIDGLPTGLMKPFSGGGARALMIEAMTAPPKGPGPDSIPGRLACIIQGSTETTFYIAAVYCGSVGIKHSRYMIPFGLLADLAGLIASIILVYVFFG